MNIAVLGSGRGSNLQAIIDSPIMLGINISVVISDKENAGILNVAKKHQIPREYVGSNCWVCLLKTLSQYDIDLIVLAGWLKHIHPDIIKIYRNKIINIHPSLLPKHGGKGMYGMNVHKAVIAAGDTKSGVTVHFVNEEYDAGDVLFRYAIDVREGETPESLAKRVLNIEHVLLPAAIRVLKEIA